MHSRHVLLPVLCFFISLNINAQQPDSTGLLVLDNIDTWKIHSSIIGEDYTLYVLKTDNYDTTKTEFPVLYMTDGDWNMTVAMNCFRMLRQSEGRYGYSMGGMFTTYVLFNRSDLFQKIYIGAPGNNGYQLMPMAREYFKTHNQLKSKVFIGVGSFERINYSVSTKAAQ